MLALNFFALTPKDWWFKIPMGRICYTCLNSKGLKGVCKNRRCSEEKGVPQVLLCAACTPWAAAKGWGPFSFLMFRKPEHGQDRPKTADAKKFFKKYLGKINSSIIDTNISFAVNFNYPVYSLVLCTKLGVCACCDKSSPPNTSTPTFDSELGVKLIPPL